MPLSLRNIAKRVLPSTRFWRGVTVLAGATGAAQFINIAIMPLLTRIYTPEEFGGLAIYSSILGFLGVAASLRYELAIPLPKVDASARLLLVLSLLLVLTLTALVTAATAFFGRDLLQLLDASYFERYLWIIPIGFFLVGLYQAFNYWAIRTRAYQVIARTKLLQAVGQSLTQLSLGLAHLSLLGLLIGHIIGQASGITSLARHFWSSRIAGSPACALGRLAVLARRYQRFPIFSAPSSLMNAGAQNFPILLVTLYYGAANAGLFLVALRVVGMPLQFFGGSISQAFHGEAAELLRSDPKKILPLFVSISKKLLFMALLPTAVLFLFGENLFSFALGQQWSKSGQVASILAFMLFFRFVIGPLALVLSVINKQNVTLIIQLMLVIGSAAGLSIPHHFLSASFLETMLVFSVVMGTLYSLVFVICYRALRSFSRA